MKIHVLSDLHLGFQRFVPPATTADVVVLAGDIAPPHQTVAFAACFGKPVLYVPGNHEYYGAVLPSARGDLPGLTVGTSVNVLDDSEVVIAGVRFLGATLWTDLALFGTGERGRLAEQTVWQCMRDYQYIELAPGTVLTPEATLACHRASLAFLERALARPHPGPTVVVTHHAPSPRSIHPRLAGALINAAYASDVERLFGPHVPLWIHGHTYNSFDYTLNGTRVVCNPRGYVIDGEVQNDAFDPGLVVEV